MSLPVRALSGDAAAFLASVPAVTAFDGDPDAEAAAAFLAAERSRLGTKVGAESLDARERAVATTDADLGDGVAVRTYRPEGGDPVKPLLVYVHGGGWVSGGIDQHDSTCRILAAAGDLVVVNVDYRLAPEHPYPAALDDVRCALRWAWDSAAASGADPTRTAICGSSSGGNLAAAVALLERTSVAPPSGGVPSGYSAENPSLRANEAEQAESGGVTEIPRLALQVLLYPALDAGMGSASYAENGQGYFVTSGQMAWYWESYRGDSGVAADEPGLSPLAAPDLAGVAPAIVVTAEFDLLRDDGVRYAERLAEAGVPVRRQHFPGQIHGFLGLLGTISEAHPAVVALGATVGDALRRGSDADVWQGTPT